METKIGQESQRINIELPGDLEAIYANFAVISHSPSEIIIDLARLLPNSPKGKIYARVVMTPMNAKLLHRALGTNLEQFETQFGVVDLPDQNKQPGESHSLGFRQS